MTLNKTATLDAKNKKLHPTNKSIHQNSKQPILSHKEYNLKPPRNHINIRPCRTLQTLSENKFIPPKTKKTHPTFKLAPHA